MFVIKLIKSICIAIIIMTISGCANTAVRMFGHEPSTEEKVKATIIDVASSPIQAAILIAYTPAAINVDLKQNADKEEIEKIVNKKIRIEDLSPGDELTGNQNKAICILLTNDNTVASDEISKLLQKTNISNDTALAIYNHVNTSKNDREYVLNNLLDSEYFFTAKQDKYPLQHYEITPIDLLEIAKKTNNINVAEDVINNQLCTSQTISIIYDKFISKVKTVDSYYFENQKILNSVLVYRIATHSNTPNDILDNLTDKLTEYKKSYNANLSTLYGLSKNKNLTNKSSSKIIEAICTRQPIGYDGGTLENLTGKRTCN